MVDLCENSSRKGGSIHTFTGHVFYPLDPREEDIFLVDVVHAISNKARFTGHTSKFYCVTPESRVLTANLCWVPAGELVLGQQLIAFQEHAEGVEGNRKLVSSEVWHTGIIKRRVYRLILSDGTELRSSAEHPWLAGWGGSRGVRRETTENIVQAFLNGKKCYLPRYFKPWSEPVGYDIGFMAEGIERGGHIYLSKGVRNLGKGLYGTEELQVVGVTFEGEQDVVALETNSRTYFAEGFGAHNSSGEHAVRVSWCLRDMGFDLMTQYVGLHHDDSDAFLPDVPTPLKELPEFAWFRQLERTHQDLCFRRFGCITDDDSYKAVKKADVILFLTEQRDLMPRVCSNIWGKKYEEKYGVTAIPAPYLIRPWTPEEAKERYLERNKELANSLIQDYPRFRCNGLAAGHSWP